MRRGIGVMFWLESALSALAALLAIVTVTWHDWIEIVLRVDPDHRNGSLELALTIGCSLLALLFAALARHGWRKAAPV